MERRRFLTTAGSLASGAAVTPLSAGVTIQESGELLWKYDGLPSKVDTPPTVVNETVFIGTYGDHSSVHAIDASDGEERWQNEASLEIRGAPAVGGGSVYVVADGLYAFDESSGTELWSCDCVRSGFNERASPKLSEGTVYVGGGPSSPDGVVAIDSSDGARQWAVDAPGEVSPVIESGRIYFGDESGTLHAITTDGERLWETDVTNAPLHSPTVADGTVFAGSNDSNLYAIDTMSGARLWTFDEPSGDSGWDGDLFGGPTVHDGTVYIGSTDSNLYAVDADTGDSVWTFSAGESIMATAPTVVGDSLFVVSGETLHAVNANTGMKQWDVSAHPLSIWAYPIVVDGVVYVCGNKFDNPDFTGSLYAIDAAVEGSSEDSRVQLATYNHHHDIDRTSPVPSRGDAWIENCEPSEQDNSISITFEQTLPFSSTIEFDVVLADVEVGGSPFYEEIDRLPLSTGEVQLPATTTDSSSVTETTIGPISVSESPSIRDGEYEVILDPSSPVPTDAGGSPMNAVSIEEAFCGEAIVADGEIVRIRGDRIDVDDTTRKPWPQFQGNIRNTSYNPDLSPPGGSVTERWQFQTGRRVLSSPAIGYDTVFFGTSGGTLFALDARSGEEQWRYTAESDIKSSPAVVDGAVYVGSHDKHVHAIDAGTGEGLWQYETEQSIRSSPTVDDGRLFIGDNLETLYAIDTNTGELEWSLDTNDWVSGTPAVSGETVVVASDQIYAMDTATGERQWTVYREYSFDSSPAVSDGTVVLGGDQILALDVETGDVQWESDGGVVSSSPAIAGDTVYIGSDSSLIALDLASGRELWEFETEGNVTSSPSIAGQTVVVGSHDQSIYAIDRTTGELQWQFDTHGSVQSSAAFRDGIVYIGSGDGSLYALE
jgi:outer membrane protein assembly factor BamB